MDNLAHLYWNYLKNRIDMRDKMRQKKTRKLVEGAIIAAVFGALFMIDLYTGGMIGYGLYFILPILIVWYGYQYDIKDSLTLCVAVFFVTFFVASPMSLYYALSAMVSGIVIGYCVKQKKQETTVFLSATAITLLSNVLMYTVFATLFEMDLITEMQEVYAMMSDLFPNASMVGVDVLIQFIPLIVLFMAVVEAYVMMMLMMLVLPRLKIPFYYKFNFLMMQLPKSYGIVAVAIMMIHRLLPGYLLLDYLDIIVKAILVLQGISYVGLYFTLHKQVLFYFIAMVFILVPYSWYLYGILGILDIMIGLKRKLLYNRHML